MPGLAALVFPKTSTDLATSLGCDFCWFLMLLFHRFISILVFAFLTPTSGLHISEEDSSSADIEMVYYAI